MWKPSLPLLNRRHLLQKAACGFGSLALSDLLTRQSVAMAGQGALDSPHHQPKAKRVIFLYMHGGPSHVDTFDYKPRLQKDDGKPLPFEAAPNISAKPVLMKSPWKFKQHGESGLWCSELFPEISKQIDKLCVIKSMHTRGQSHGQAVCMLHTGTDNFVRPSVGAWVSYGLSSENENLPAFVSIAAPTAHGGPRNYGSAFLPASHQATVIGRGGKYGKGTIADLKSPQLNDLQQQEQVDLIQSLNRQHLKAAGNDRQIEGAIASFELAFRMQSTAPEVLDISGETPGMQASYGIGEKKTDNFGKQCLLARRLAESGVRYIQASTGNVWDQHGGLKAGHEKNSAAVDKPIAALLADLEQRGMLEETLVIWGGEFGRTPIAQGKNGRDHNPQGYCMWMAGGGIKPGISYGETDEFGYYSLHDRVHMHDLHATILHQLGVDHERLTYRYAGRDFRLTDVYGQVVHDIIA